MKGICLLLLIAVLSSCDQKKTEKTSLSEIKKVKVLATTGMIADVLKNILDTNASITALMGPGVDPHLYKATQGDLKLLKEADIIVYNGLHLEGKMVEIFERLHKLKTCFSMERMLNKSDFIEIENYLGNYDPHLWFDVQLWNKASYNLGLALADTLPQFSQAIIKSTKAYRLKLDSLDEEVRQTISQIPEEQRVLVTAHDAFGYFGNAYDIEVKGLQGISTLSEAGLNDISKLVNFLVDRKINAVFIETSVSKKSIEAVVAGCKNKGHNIEIGGYLYSDAMGPEGSLEGTYIGMVKKNVSTIYNSLNR